MSCTVRNPQGIRYCCRVYTVHTIAKKRVWVYSVSLSFACVELNCLRYHSSEVLGPNWTKFSGNAHNNNAIRCRKFGMLKMNRNVHSGTCSLMNFIARNFLGTTIRYKLTFPEKLVKFGQKTWT